MKSVGELGEDLACKYLKKQKWRILGRNQKIPAGEIDIIARDPKGVLVFVEVKTMTLRRPDSSPRCPACSAGEPRHDEKIEDKSSALRSNAGLSSEQAATRREQSKIPDRVVAPPRSTESTPSSSASSAQGFLTCSRCGGQVDGGSSVGESKIFQAEQHFNEEKRFRVRRLAENFANRYPDYVDETLGYRVDLIAITIKDPLDKNWQENADIRTYENL